MEGRGAGRSKFIQGSLGRVLCAFSSSCAAGLMDPHLGPLHLHSSPTAAANERERDKERVTGMKTGDRKARLREELTGDQESTQVALVLLGVMELLFLAEGPDEDRPWSPSLSARRQHLSPSMSSSLCHLQRRWVRAEQAAGGAA